MNDQTRRLVDHQKVIVLVDDVKRHGFRGEGLALRRRSQFNAELVACLDLCRSLQICAAPDRYPSAFDQLLKVAARKLRHQRRQRLVQTAAVVFQRNADLAQLHLKGGFRLVLRVFRQKIGINAGRYNKFCQF